MDRDIRATTLYRESEAFYAGVRKPGTGQISDAAEVNVSPAEASCVFTGTIVDVLEGAPPTRICRTELQSGYTQVVTFGPNSDRTPKYSPDGLTIGFLSDRRKVGEFQLYLLDPVSGAARATPAVGGWVEYLDWSPDGRRILLGVAGHGADVAGAQGAVTSQRATACLPDWMPTEETGDEVYRWRRLWVYELSTDSVRQVSPAHLNVWEAVWCGNAAIGAVASLSPDEGSWYSSRLHTIDLETGNSSEIYAPSDQLGAPAASPSGSALAIVDAVCSDRCIVTGDLVLIETGLGKARAIDTEGVDIAYTEWRSDRHLLLAGHRGFESVVGIYDVEANSFNQVWTSQDISTGGRYISIAGVNQSGDCVLVGEGFVRAPELAEIRQGTYRVIRSFDLGYTQQAKAIATVEQVTWIAPDGLAIQGWLLCPEGQGPHPLVMNIHGGPVWHWRPTWLGRGGAPFLLLLRRGFAIFFPNPRGSSGRGREFAQHVVGDMGGADADDYLSGLDHLVEQGIADGRRLGVTGVSYGGFMTSWLVAQDTRFAAAVSVAPMINYTTQHLLSNIPNFVPLFLKDTYTNPGGKYFERSPVMHAHKVTTPMLSICGALDRSAPPEEAMQFHSALREHRVKSTLLVYPQEGHGIRQFPANIDYAARVVSWFLEHMPAEEGASSPHSVER
jgi:dipeptidyl aminopeptidase/acylaminoacyl peptidase